MGFKINKQQVKILAEYVEEVHALLEEAATDPQTQALIGENMEDTHFQARYIVEEWVKEMNGENE